MTGDVAYLATQIVAHNDVHMELRVQFEEYACEVDKRQSSIMKDLLYLADSS